MEKRYVALEDLISYSRKKKEIYAKKGDQLKLVSLNGDAVILEDKKGKRFPTHISKIEEV